MQKWWVSKLRSWMDLEYYLLVWRWSNWIPTWHVAYAPPNCWPHRPASACPKLMRRYSLSFAWPIELNRDPIHRPDTVPAIKQRFRYIRNGHINYKLDFVPLNITIMFLAKMFSMFGGKNSRDCDTSSQPSIWLDRQFFPVVWYAIKCFASEHWRSRTKP